MQAVECRDMSLDVVLVAEVDGLWHVLGNPTASSLNAVLPQQYIERADRHWPFRDSRHHQQAINPDGDAIVSIQPEEYVGCGGEKSLPKHRRPCLVGCVGSTEDGSCMASSPCNLLQFRLKVAVFHRVEGQVSTQSLDILKLRV